MIRSLYILMCDEVKLIYDLIHNIFSEKLMIDVGAFRGSSLKLYNEIDYTIYAFEPNPWGYERIKKQNVKNNITIENKCVSNKEEDNVKFYLSKTSGGISSLTPFHSSHEEVHFTVSSVRLDNYMKSKKIGHVNFLKIDTEGHDYFVLQSYPWNLDKPDVILCEFEDLKTKRKLNYIWKDMASYLTNLGYTIIISEWYPIVKYGTQYKFRGFKEYPCELHHENAWGKFICFKDYALLEHFKCKHHNMFIYNIEKLTLKSLQFTKITTINKSNTIFIMGNGRSLAKCSFYELQKYTTFGMNSAYKKYKELNFYPTYFGSHDPKLITHHYKQFKDLLNNSPIKKFFFSQFNTKNKIQFTQQDILNPKFQKINFIYNKDYESYIPSTFKKYYNLNSTGANATLMSIIMGYQNIILLGCDCNYTEIIKEAKISNKQTQELVITETPKNNENYWFSNYQEKGDIYSIPTGETNHMTSWRIVKEAANYHNVRIANCSDISKIPYFDKSTFAEELNYIE
jgi:FkbM family methyltransferase